MNVPEEYKSLQRDRVKQGQWLALNAIIPGQLGENAQFYLDRATISMDFISVEALAGDVYAQSIEAGCLDLYADIERINTALNPAP